MGEGEREREWWSELEAAASGFAWAAVGKSSGVE
jgi:hypothetical protein